MFFLAEKRTEITKNGIKTVIDEVDDKDNGMYRVISTYKVISKKVPQVVANRKKWRKFGASIDDGSGPNIQTTYATEEVPIQFLRNLGGDIKEEDESLKQRTAKASGVSRGHCRFCKTDDHWSVNCPYKVYQILV